LFFVFCNQVIYFYLAFVATLLSSFYSSLSNCVAVYPEQSEGSHTCTPVILRSNIEVKKKNEAAI